MRYLKKVKDFIVQTAAAAKRKVVDFVRGLYHHTEATIIVVLAALGLNALVGELPFLFLLPMWIEAPMVIPVLSVGAIWALLKLAEWRADRRQLKLVAA